MRASARAARDIQLGPLESAVIDRLWAAGAALDIARLQAEVGTARGVSRSTIHSTVERLVRKGLVVRRKRGRAYEYRAAGTRAQWVADRLESLLDAMPEADPSQVLAGFVDFADRAPPATLESLEALVRARLQQRAEGEES